VNGILVIDKPVGVTSAYVLNGVKRLLPRGTRIGHAGTLDALASGVLVALIGSATKWSDQVMGMPKQYQGVIRLGARSMTDDAEGPITPSGAAPVDRHSVEAALMRFVGSIEQAAPAYSALKIEGKRSSDRVRAGEAVVVKTRIIHVSRIELLAYAWPDASVLIDCGRGTYVRSIARDLGEALGTGGHLASLVRTKVGPFDIEHAWHPDAPLLDAGSLLDLAGTPVNVR
jgi:tRNA pseudouridine55 synthase